MHRFLTLAASALIAVACAPTPPPPMTTAEIGVPKRLVLSPQPPNVPVDIELPTGAVAVPLSPGGIIAAAVANVAIAAINASITQVRTARRDSLSEAIGETGVSAADFTTTFDAELVRALRANPALNLLGVTRMAAGDIVKTPGEASFTLERDLMFTQDGRWLVARAAAFHTGVPGAERRPVQRRYIVFSTPVPGETPEVSAAAWRAGDGRLLREQAQSLARDLALLVATTQFDPQPIDLERLPEIVFHTSGIAVPSPRTADNAQRVAGAARGWLVRRGGDRAVVLVRTFPHSDDWVWVSVPLSVLPSGAGS